MYTGAATVAANAASRPEDSFSDLDNQRHHGQQTGSRGTAETNVVGPGADVAGAVDAEVPCIPWRSRD